MTTPATALASPTAEPQLAIIRDTVGKLLQIAMDYEEDFRVNRDQAIQLVLASVLHHNAQLKLAFDAYCVGLDIADEETPVPTTEENA
jgi:hypothetical protein